MDQWSDTGVLSDCLGDADSRVEVWRPDGRHDAAGSDGQLDESVGDDSKLDVLLEVEVACSDCLFDMVDGDVTMLDGPGDSSEGDERDIWTDWDGLGDDAPDTTDAAELEEYPCPNGYNGEKDLMPPCPYDEVISDMYALFSEPVQFEVYDEESSPGLPEGFELSAGQRVVLLRVRWIDFFADWFPMVFGCPADKPGCKACGGHCFPQQDYVFVIDMDKMEVVFAAKEEFETQSDVSPCMQNGQPTANCFSLYLPQEQVTFKLITAGSELAGTTNTLPNALRLYDGESWTQLKSIPLPLF